MTPILLGMNPFSYTAVDDRYPHETEASQDTTNSPEGLPRKRNTINFLQLGRVFLPTKNKPFNPSHLPSLKLTAKAPENGWLEYDPFLLGRPIFRGEPLVSGTVPIFNCGYSEVFHLRQSPIGPSISASL